RLRQTPQFVTQAERTMQRLRKSADLFAFAKVCFRFRRASSSSEAGDLAFDERQLDPSDARRFARAEDGRDSRLLKLVDLHIAIADRTAQQHRQLNIRDQMKTTGEVVARDFFDI